MKTVAITGSFDNLGSKHVRFLQEAAKYGVVHVGLWSDKAVLALEGGLPRFPECERLYLLHALRYAGRVTIVEEAIARDAPPQLGAVNPDVWVVDEASDSTTKRASAEAASIRFRVLMDEQLKGFPIPPQVPAAFDSNRPRVLVTGCFDWLHSGHVRFFEEASALGQLYVVVGHDANIKLLKGDGHPLLSQDERLYMVSSIRYVHQAMVSTGHGWMDAEPEFGKIQPHIYVVNEDGDNSEKRAFCARHGIEYKVLKRIPKEGLPERQSTLLRGF